MKPEDIHNHLAAAKDFLRAELAQIRTGRASSALVEEIKVRAYEGSEPLPLKELGTISIPDAQSITITPWDKSVLQKIEKGILESGKGLNPVNDGESIRVPIPPLTEERRIEMTKQVSAMVEEAKIKVRNIRQNAIKAAEEMEENGVISEDELHRQKKVIEDDISKVTQELIEMGKTKEQELMTV